MTEVLFCIISMDSIESPVSQDKIRTYNRERGKYELARNKRNVLGYCISVYCIMLRKGEMMLRCKNWETCTKREIRFVEKESMKAGEGCQESFNIGLKESNDWWEKHTAGCGRCSGRYRPVGCKHFADQSCIYEMSGYTKGRCRYCLKVSKPCKEPYRPVKSTTETAKSNRILISKKADNRYYKLADGNILDLETKAILFRDGLLQIMQ